MRVLTPKIAQALFLKVPIAAAVAFSASVPLSSYASVLEEIVVTAQKREQNLQDVGISVSAFSGDQMKALGITSTVEITQQTPALQVNAYTPGVTILNLRGVSQNSFQDNLEAPVAVYVDGAYVASMNAIAGQLFDVERVEVLRGPQGTLFGRNSTGGLVHYVSRGATDEELNGYIEGTIGEFNQRAFEGAIGGALSDTVRARLAARWEESDGFIEAVNPGVEDSQAIDMYTIRGSLQVDITKELTADLRVTYTEDDDVAAGSFSADVTSLDPRTGLGRKQAPAGFPERVTDPDRHSSFLGTVLNRDVTTATLTFNWDINDSVELISISNYLDLSKLEELDGSAGFLENVLGIPFVPPYIAESEFSSFSQEIRLSGDADKLRWQAGVYYLDLDVDTTQTIGGAPFFGLGPDGVLPGGVDSTFSTVQVATGDVDAKNWSVFGQIEYDISDNTTIIAGLRWSDDQKDLDYRGLIADPSLGISETPVFDSSNLPSGLDKIDYADYAARLQLNYTTDEGTLLYASYNRGIKGGNWSLSATGTLAQSADPSNVKHDEEVLNSYELGIKTELNDWSRLNVALYHYDYEDYQAFALVDLQTQIENTDASSYGGEIELTMTPAEGWDLLLGLAYIDSEIDVVNVPGVASAPNVQVFDNDFPNAPTWNVNFLARYAWGMFGGEMALQVDGVWYDEQFLETTNSELSLEDSYAVVNARLSYTSSDDNWEIAAWIKNLTDTEYRLYNRDVTINNDTAAGPLFGFSHEAYGPPRWAGITANYRF